jgi:arylsulfatase A-like enzyme
VNRDRCDGARRIALLAILGVLGVACKAAPPPKPRLIVLYATCTVNKGFLAPYADGIDFTPNFARFGHKAAVFTNHQTEAGISGPAFASIYAGAQADRHGVFKHPKKLEEDLYLIFEAFADAGYDPYYWTAHVMSRPGLNYAQGVEETNIIRAPLTGDDERFTELLTRLDEDENYRALVVTSFSVTHDPWDLAQADSFRESFPGESGGATPEEVRHYHDIFRANHIALQTRFETTIARLKLTPNDVDRLAAVLAFLYKSKINLLDSHFGGVVRAIDEAGLGDESVVAFTADHGETLYEEGRRFNWTHAPDLSPEVINVPLMIRGHPDLVPARTINAVTRSIDVYPTLAGLAGIALPPEKGVAGVDLSGPLRGDRRFPDLRAYSHGTLRHWQFFDPDRIENIWASLRVGDLLYTWRHLDSKWSFDVRRAGAQARNDAPSAQDPEHKAAARDLWAYREGMVKAYLSRHRLAAALSKREALKRLNQEELESLRSMGYIE